MIKPPALRPGDTIGIVAPASNVKEELLLEGCAELERLGFKVRYRPDIVSSFRYLSGTLDRRAAEFIDMVRDPGIRAIFCARGGYGSGHLIPRLDPRLFTDNPKIISGASDITLLLNYIEQSGVVSFHGPMAATTIRQGESGYDRRLLLGLLQNGEAVKFPTEGCKVLRSGEGMGRLKGGCLSLIVATLGTPYELDTRDAIFVIEDIDAKPYQVDRMLTQLKHAGKFNHVRGVVFGEMLNCVQHPNQGYTLEDVLFDLLGEYRFPVLYGFPTGHTSRPNVIVPFGVRARLVLGAELTFELLESAVTAS
jgi:muramoyltetrapeptide carboxypeptidase